MVLDLRIDRSGLDHRSYRLARRTPVLYSRNQSRTNIALSKEMNKGGGQLAELIYMILEGGRVVCRGSSSTARRTASWSFHGRFHRGSSLGSRHHV